MSENVTETDQTFALTSSATPDGSVVAPPQLVEALGGQNLSPDLAWTDAPEGTRSFAVTCYDPDAPASSLPTGLPREDASSPIRQAVNDFGNLGFDGPEPPAGPPHRYQFSVHALPVESLGVEQGAPNVQARFAIFTQQLSSTSLTARYQVTG
jgi:Raf kinase inhibitor-like YbhB/YbcL family protein